MAELLQFSTVLLVLPISWYMTECPNVKRMNDVPLTIYTFIYSSINEHWDCIALELLYIEHLWTEVNKYPLVILWLPLWTIYLEVELLAHMVGTPIFEGIPIQFFTTTKPFYIPRTMHKVLTSPLHCQHILKIEAALVGMKCYLIVVWISILWWSMMFNLFPYAFWTLVYLLYRNS